MSKRRSLVRHKLLPLTREQETFALEYVKHGNAKAAYIAAFPDRKAQHDNTQLHSNLLKKPAMQTRIHELMEAAKVVDELSAEFLIAELKKNIEEARGIGDFGASNKAIELAMRYKAMIGEKAVQTEKGVNVNLNLFSGGDRDKDLARLANIAGFVPAKTEK